MRRLDNTVMGYDWGSRRAIAELQGRAAPTAAPEAELWIGAHASAPSRIRGEEATLAECIARAPEAELGPSVRARFGDRMPFLLKVLAAEVPLSLQAHPDRSQAEGGFAREQALGIPLAARHRCYKDASHKPEILCALGPFEALCGFRPAAETLELAAQLAVPALDAVLEPLRRSPGPDGLAQSFAALMTLELSASRALVGDVVGACRREAPRGGTMQPSLEWAIRLAALHPGDVGVVASLMLNYVSLRAGDAIVLGAGMLHSYLGGTGIELMASSDNVLRGGLTTKHVDVPELLAILDFCDGPCEPVPLRALDEHESEYVAGVEDFRLTRIEVENGEVCRPARRGPELLLCAGGAVFAEDEDGERVDLACGESVFVGASEGEYTLGGTGTVFRATVGDFTRPQAS